MKIRWPLYVLLFLTLHSCLVRVNTISWEDPLKPHYRGVRIADIPNYKPDTSNFKLSIEIQRATRVFMVPFIVSYTHKKKPIYNPVVNMTSMD